MSDLVDSLSRNLRGYWCPMLQYGGLTLRDQTRFKNNGTLTNMDASTDWVMSRVKGRSGRVLDFDGVDDHVADCGNTSSFAFIIHPYVFTIEVWFKLNNLSTRAALAGSTGTQADRGFFLTHEIGVGAGTNAIRLAVNHGTLGDSKFFRSPDSVVVAGWNHAVVIGRTTAANSTMLINGLQVAITVGQDATLSAGAATRRMSLGALRTSTGIGLPTSGQIASFGIWSRSLAISEAQSLYRLGPGWYQPQLPRRIPYSEQQAGFKAYWHRRQSQLIGGGV